MSHLLEVLAISAGAILGWELSQRWFNARPLHLAWIAARQRKWSLVWLLLWKPDEIESVQVVLSDDSNQERAPGS